MTMTMTDIISFIYHRDTWCAHAYTTSSSIWWFPDSDSDSISTRLGLLDPVPVGFMPTDQSKSKAKEPLHKKLNPFITHIYRHKIIQIWWHQSCILALSSYVHDPLNKSSQNIIYLEVYICYSESHILWAPTPKRVGIEYNYCHVVNSRIYTPSNMHWMSWWRRGREK